MQKRVVYNFNAQTATESAAENSTGKAVKASNAISKIKRAFSGKSIKLAVLVVLLFVSLFCTIGSADWIISQQKNVPNDTDNGIFKFDDLGLNNHIDIPTVAFSGKPAQAIFSKTALNSGRDLPAEAVSEQNIQYKVKPYNETSAQSRVFRAPKNATASTAKNMAPAAYANETLPDEKFFDGIEWTKQLPTDAGTYAVLITSTTVDGVSYGKAIKVFTIAPCPVKIEWSGNQGFTYDGTAHSITATAYKADENGTPITENILSISLTYKAPNAADSTAATTVTEVKNAGTYTATASINNNKNYAISSSETETATTTFKVEQKALTVKADNKTVTYGNSAPAYTFSCDGLVSTDSPASLGTPTFSCSYSTTSTVAGRPYEIKVSGLTNSNYNITYVSGTLTVNKRALTLNWGTTSFVYNGEAQTPNPTANNVVTGDDLGLTVTITGENITGSPAAAINVGTYTAEATITNNNYEIAAGNQTATFAITARALTVKAEDKTVTYGDSAPAYTFSCDGLVSTDSPASLGTPTFSCDYTPTSAVGTYTITVSGLTNSNYNITYYSGTLTVTPGTITVTVIGKTISYGDPAPTSYELTCDNPDINANISVLGTPKFSCDYTTKSPVGTYPITVSGLALANYTISCKSGNLIVNQRKVTVSGWNKTSFTYNGAEQKPEPSFDNVVTGDNLKATVEVNKPPKNKGTYTATVTIFNSNYTLSGSNSTSFTIKPLDIEFNGIIECNYASGGITFNAGLFSGKFKAVDTSSSVNLSTAHNDIIDGTAKNFNSANGVAVTAENGLFSYTFGETTKITAGSTYLISDIALKEDSNFNLTTNRVYLKYKTAKIGTDKNAPCYTIEDALAQNGTITLCGGANGDSSYVITAFAKLSPITGSDFSNYKSDYKYTLSGKKLIVPFNDSATEEDVSSSYTDTGNVYSAFLIQKGITLTLSSLNSSSASVIAAAQVGFNQDISTTLAKNHGVIMNNGNIVVNSGCSVTAYGYIKGNGLIQMNSGATALDALSIYDWPGGNAAKAIYKTVFPTNAYTVHNISCPTQVFSGAIYKARVYLNALSGTAVLNETIVIIGTQNNKGMFNADSDSLPSDYILKSVVTNQKDVGTKKDINNNITLSNQRVSSTVATLNHRDNIEIYGKYSDAPTEISKTVLFITIALKTSTKIPLPVGFMDITVKDKAALTLTSSDYLILPGAKLTVDNGGTLTLGNAVDLVALPYSSAPTTGNRCYTKYYTANTDGNGKKDGKLIVNGTLNGSGYNLGGNISTEEAGATLNVVNASGSYVTMYHTDSPYYVSGTVNAFGDIMTSPNSYAQRDLSTGTYYSKEVNGKFVWYSQTATISFKANGNPYSTISRTVGSNGYTISAADYPTTDPTKDYYTFENWYIDEALTTKATGQTIFVSCTLYAGWTANTYTITYKFKYNGEEYSPEYVDNSANQKTTYTYEDSFFLAPATSHNGYKFYRWYSDEACTEPITQISGMGENITLYGEFIDPNVEVYVVTYVTNNNEVDTPSAENVKSTEVSNFKVAELGKITNNDTSKTKYFLGWYTDETCETLFNGSLTGSVTLYAGWADKFELTINVPIFENGIKTNNYYPYKTKKYYYNTAKIPDISQYPQISSEIPNGYKFVGFTATTGCTATINYQKDNTTGIITGIVTQLTNISNGLTITADIRKILKVDITMTASAKPRFAKEKYFEINKITVSANSFYSKTGSDDWLISDGTTDIKQSTKGTQTFYLLEGSTNITVTIESLSFIAHSPRDVKAPETTGCLTNDTKSPFTFTIKESNATIKWEGQQS